MDYQDNLPLSEAVFFILLSLVPRARHGYAIMKEVEVLSDSRVSLSTGPVIEVAHEPRCPAVKGKR